MPTARLPQGTIHYSETGSGRPVVFVHGYLMAGDLWDRLAAELAPRGYRCIAPTWPHGAHPEPMAPGADLTPTGLAALVAAFIGELGLEDAVLVGNDTGGAICQVVAAEHADAIGALVLTNCDAFENFPPSFFKALPLVARVPGGIGALVQPFRAGIVRRSPLGYGLLSRTGVDDLAREWVKPALGSAAVRRDLRKVTRGLRPRYTLAAAAKLASFRKPALVAWAPGDRLFPEEHGRRLATLLPQGRFQLVPDSGTFSMVDQPAALAALIAGSLAGSADADAHVTAQEAR
jgi:pimeloyl-ACP methyl ester carboxylesterase